MTAASDLRSLAIRATKGNKLMDFISEDMQKGMFQILLQHSDAEAIISKVLCSVQ